MTQGTMTRGTVSLGHKEKGTMTQGTMSPGHNDPGHNDMHPVKTVLNVSLLYAASNENGITCAHQWSGFHIHYDFSTYRGHQTGT